MSPVTKIGGGIAVASRGLVLGEGIRVPAVVVPGGPVTFVSDTFTDTAATALEAHTGEVGATWVKHPSLANGLVIGSLGRVRCTSNGLTGLYYASGIPGSAEYDVTAPLVFSGTTATAMTYGVLGRIDTVATTYYSAHYTTTGTVWTLSKTVAGSVTSLGTYVGDAITAGLTKTLKLEIRDASKKLFVDGVERISSVDDAITAAGKVGVRGVQTTVSDPNGIQIDSLVAVTV